MRKLWILALLCLVIGVNAQDRNVGDKNNYALYTGLAGDTINTSSTVTVDFYIELAKKSHYTLSYMCDVDTLNGGGGDDFTIQPQGSYDGTTFTSIGSALTCGATADTAFNKTINSTFTVTESGTIAAYDIPYIGTHTIASYTAPHSGSSDFGSDSVTVFTDTTTYSAQTITRTDTAEMPAQTWTNTNTVNIPGYDYNWIRILFTGGGASRAEVELVAIKVTPIDIFKP